MDKDRRKELEMKAALGTLSLSEMQEIVTDLRQGRLSAGFASKAAKGKKVAAKKAQQEELAEDVFEGLNDE